MMKKLLVASAVLFGSLLLSVAFAQDEQQAVDVDQVIAKCEEQFSAETYTDENERNRLIDECIEKQLNTGKGQADEG